jgi:hypothetical protein
MTQGRIFLLAACVLISSVGFSQIIEKKQMTASRAQLKPKLDGLLNDACWDNAESITRLVQNRPNPGSVPSQKTEIKIVYNDDAIYVGAYMYETAPDSILNQLTQRDNIGNSDFFGVWFSPFQDGINGFEFITTPAGVQFDALLSTFGEDTDWNAVWQCETSIQDDGWIAEMKIPYSAIRFPKMEEQHWDVNFMRRIRRLREQSFWQHVDPQVDGIVNQSGQINGIKNISPPPRLFFYPYASGYLQANTNEDGNVFTGTSYNGGMDIKYGINDAFTLDMTLIPDFGQVQSDNQVLNLSPFEVRFNEQRQFFTEGTELFTKGGLFYSRRIGAKPVNADSASVNLGENETVTVSPNTTQLLNATKVSGRNKNGLGVGVFNAVTAREYATIEDNETGETRQFETSPLVNYNILVLDQNLKNNSFVTLINTNVLRDGATYDANVTGTRFSFKNKSNVWELEGGGTYNHKFNWQNDTTDNGYAYNVGINKNGGNFLFGVGHSVESKYFDKNDLGFLFNPNEMNTYAWASYNIYEPFGRWNNLWSNFNMMHEMLYEPNVFTGLRLNGNVGINSRKFNTFNVFWRANPIGGYDYFGPRVDGRYFQTPVGAGGGGWISSDYRKRLAFDASIGGDVTEISDWREFNWRVEPRFRVNDKLMFTYVYSFQTQFNERGWAAHDDVADEVIYARRDRVTHTNVLNTNYTFNNRMGLTFRLRHYWSSVDNHDFMQLEENGELSATDYQGFYSDGTSQHDVSFNAFNIDMVYTWVFAPGSELSVVWKNSILDSDEALPSTWVDNFDRTVGLPQNNSFSIKILYFLDYLTFVRKEKMIEN